MTDVLYTMSNRWVKIERIGDVPEGERVNFHYAGEVDGAELRGTLRGIDYSCRVGNRIAVHIHEVLSTTDDELVTIERTGHSAPTDDEGMVLLRGQLRAQTAAPRLAWLNGLPLIWEARIPQAGREFTAFVYKP
jgi:hypothetical protein